MTDLQSSQPGEPLFSAEPESPNPEKPAEPGTSPAAPEAEPIPPASPPVTPGPQPGANSQKPPPAPQTVPPAARRRRRGSLFFPLLLIVLGAVLLLNNLGYITGSVWDTLINLWPVLFIVWGLDLIWRGDGVTGAVFLLGLGIVFLLGNFGYLRLNPWQVFLTIWPVLLVAVGLDILLSHHRRWWTTLLGFILVAAIMAGALWLAGIGLPGGQVVTGDQIEFGLQGATRAGVQLSPAAASLELDKLMDSDALLAGTIPVSTATYQITQEFTKSGDTAILKLKSTGTQVFYQTTGQNQYVWDLGLTPDVPVKLDVNLGAGDATLDLTGLQISGLNYDMGVGAVTITLPANGNFTATVDGAMGSITILVPSGTAVVVNMDTALTARTLPEAFVKTGDHSFASPGYSTAQNQVVLDLNLAFGQVTVQAK
jgi:hypothetical protein